MADNIRPTKKQRELLDFIENFIHENGYSPSYREIMNGCSYTSVATVALHVNSLITRGHLTKRDNSARSLEVVKDGLAKKIDTPEVLHATEAQSKWLVKNIEALFERYEQTGDKDDLDSIYVLLGALKVLGLEDAMRSFLPRLPQ